MASLLAFWQDLMTSRRFLALLLCSLSSWACVDDTTPTSPIQVTDHQLVTTADLRRWPDFFLFDVPGGRYVWGEQGRLRWSDENRQVASGADAVSTAHPRSRDRIIAATRAPDGRLAFLDSSGYAVVQRTREIIRRIQLPVHRPALDIALSGDRLYLLLSPTTQDDRAVVAYSLAGREVAQWRPAPTAAWFHPHLSGGGITACPDGAVYFSYVNSDRILRLGRDAAIEPLGAPDASFERISDWRVRWTREKLRRGLSGASMVKLGLKGSRVDSLICSERGFLFRQVIHPGGRGSSVEVWDPALERRVGEVSTVTGKLFDVYGALYLLSSSDPQSLRVERLEVRLELQQKLLAQGE